MDTWILVVGAAVALAVIGMAVFYVNNRRAEPDTEAIAPPRKPRAFPSLDLRRVFGATLDNETWSELEEALIAADVGVEASAEIVEKVQASRPDTPDEAHREVANAIKSELAGKDRHLHLEGEPAVILVVGVNGTGKTTTIAKLAKHLQLQGRTVTLGAGDTFRAAAAEQLQTWGERLGVQVVRGQEGGDPASVAFDTIDSARAKGVDVVMIDTAGRLHGKKNLMAELSKIHRVSGGDSVDEVLLVLDATAGQNGLSQVSEFSQAVPISGIVLTKLDGTARGGIVIAVERKLGVPVKFVGLGEGMDDLEPFKPDSFVDALLA